MGTFKDSLKRWFYTNSSSAASSDARIPLLTATGEPKGSDTMANIASKLGGLQFVGTQNDANIIGTYMSTTSTNTPQNFPTGGYFTLISIGDTAASLCFQIAFNTGGAVYVRVYWGSWKSWTKIN